MMVWEPVWKFCIYLFETANLSSKYVCLWIWNQELVQNNSCFSGIFSLSTQPRAPQRATMHTLFWMSYFLLHFPLFFPFAWIRPERFHKLTAVMQMSLGRQESLGSTPQQWIRESSTVQLSFLVTQKAPWFRNNPSSSFISSSLLSAMYLDKVDFWLFLIKDKLTLIWIIYYFIWIPSIWSWEFPGIPLKYAFCCS